MYEQIGTNTFFVYHKDIEYLFAALEKLSHYGLNQNIPKVYETIEKNPEISKFRFLFEVFRSIKSEYQVGFLEFMIYCDVENFTLEKFEKYLLSLPKVQFLSIFFNGIPKEEFEEVERDEQQKQAFFERHSDLFSQYLAYQFFIEEPHNLIQMFFQFVAILKNEDSEFYLNSKETEVELEKNMIQKALETQEPFAFSEELMGKNCYNRGPYKIFYFMPSVYFPLLFCRIFGEDQFLFYDYQRLREKKANVPEQLKAIADNTRYRILLLLKEEGHLTGVDVAKKLKLATSTISHHMTILKDNGLIHEEPVGNTKCYSISKRSFENCIKVLSDTFLK
jgi:DNA-binding transcriptional ArsR family regulator